MPPIPPLGIGGVSFFGCSAIVASVVTMRPAIEEAIAGRTHGRKRRWTKLKERLQAH